MSQVVEKDKIVRYLLNEDHPDGGSKAYFFQKIGFSTVDWQVFENALLSHYEKNVHSGEEVLTAYGLKYVLTGYLETPMNENVLIKSVWFKENGSEIVKLVTAYPF